MRLLLWELLATNLAGQPVIPVLVSVRAKILDRDKYADARSIDLDTLAPEVQPTGVAV